MTKETVPYEDVIALNVHASKHTAPKCINRKWQSWKESRIHNFSWTYRHSSLYLIEPVNHIAVGCRNLNNAFVGSGICTSGSSSLHLTVLICGPCHSGRSGGLPHARWGLKRQWLLSWGSHPISVYSPRGGSQCVISPKERTAWPGAEALRLSANSLITELGTECSSSNQVFSNSGQQIGHNPTRDSESELLT